MVIILVIVLAFGVCVQALMYHNQKFEPALLENVFFGAYIIILGESGIVDIMLNSKYTIKNMLLEGAILFIYLCRIMQRVS